MKMNNKDLDWVKEQGLILAPGSLSSDEKEIWAKGYTHGRILGEAVGAARSLEEIAKEMLKCNYSIDEISKMVGTFEERIESLQLEESIKHQNEL